jgi:glycosyltransferase involved in cell wall biosynthesis
MVRISTVIPTYNRAELLERSVRSVLAQTRPADEVLVVDDGSTDATADVVRALGPTVRYLRQANAGASAARNHGVRVASGEYVAFLDSDDEWASDFLARMDAAIVATGAYGLTYFADLAYTDTDLTAWELSSFDIPGEHELREDASEWFMRPVQPMTTQASLIRREAYQALGGQDVSIRCRHDTHLFLLLGFAGPAAAVKCRAGTMTAEGGEGKLTRIHHPESRSYREDTVAMYRDVLRRGEAVSTLHRRELRRRLATGYWRLARLAWKEKQFRACLDNLARSLCWSPRVACERVAAWTASNFRRPGSLTHAR